MPEFFCELFSEEIPARLQAPAAADFARLAAEALAPLAPADPRSWSGPRRIALALTVAPAIPASRTTERGPRIAAPEAALAGFLRKHGATREALRHEGDFWVLDRESPAIPAAQLIAAALPALLRRFPWPKSMRWGSSDFTWIRPLRRILCLLDGEIVPFALAAGEDRVHDLAAGDLTEGHRFLSPGAFAVRGADDWAAQLRARHVLVSAADREAAIAAGLAARAAEAGAAIVDDPGLLREVAGLVEWPVCHLGRIDPEFMDLPPEVRQVSMRVNQRYFALRTEAGEPAPYFGFAANIDAADGGHAIVAGNERVLRARFADARHFWNEDRRKPLAERLEALKSVIFHAKLGTQFARTERIAALAAQIARATGADTALAARAGLLAKADLVTGMVGEFPELQGTMGGYYATHAGEPAEIAAAIRDHYQPKGPQDRVPAAPVTIAVALADKLDQLAGFFAVGERPTGSGDPFALRRAALGVVRIIRENNLRLRLRALLQAAVQAHVATLHEEKLVEEILAFMAERLRVQLRDEGARHDLVQAVFAAGADDDFARLLARSHAIAALLETPDGGDLLTGYRRAANILRIEDRKDGPHEGMVDPALLAEPEETALGDALAEADFARLIEGENFAEAMRRLAALRPRLDAFFDRVTVNAEDAALRRNRLRLLAAVRDSMNKIADFTLVT